MAVDVNANLQLQQHYVCCSVPEKWHQGISAKCGSIMQRNDELEAIQSTCANSLCGGCQRNPCNKLGTVDDPALAGRPPVKIYN